ncbi:hypothetical protein EIN_246870 [Entamoeba invadens IP1]|uniref:GRAM domain-containing protein n=1 Tax=Entamoeba invadens IP1 TaxID=370355 RepID=A0A0A1UE76_ENTIV|nr:hypothetical protein EIN_246870 [Entamoeba invadens IP1]ELP94793.1 hypothetical protein EIN_246870 [Entamoeba invadens IP1]|eukprot:XP_004261564.1 hypothetical protein EIN_246870 [Entamoeba invadens IP1]
MAEKRITGKDEKIASHHIQVSKDIRKAFALNDDEDVIQTYTGTLKMTNGSTKGKMHITQNFFCYVPIFVKGNISIRISDLISITDEILMIDTIGTKYTFSPLLGATECYNLMNYLFLYPFALLKLSVYKTHTLENIPQNRVSGFDFETAQTALTTAQEVKLLKLDTKRELEAQQSTLQYINKMLDKNEETLDDIDDNIEAINSITYEIKLQYTNKIKKNPPPVLEPQVLTEQLKQLPTPQKIEIKVLWKLENDTLIPAVLSIFDAEIKINEESANTKKKLLTRQFDIKSITGLFMRARPLHLNISLDSVGKEKSRLRLFATCLQFIVNEIFIRYFVLKGTNVSVTFEPNSRVFDFGDERITKTFLGSPAIKGQIQATVDDETALKLFSGKDREDYLKMREMNKKTVTLLQDVTQLNSETSRLAMDSTQKVNDLSDRMERQLNIIEDKKTKVEDTLRKYGKN